MVSSDSQTRLSLLIIGLLVIFAPAFFVLLTLEFLILSGDLLLSDVTPLALLELYILDLVFLLVFAYAVYRVTSWTFEHQLPSVLDALEDGEDDNDADETQSDDGS
ncbi:hypothetical protein [Haloarcula nitratireducens]|uniref:Uncharacterized protein n=1 Tax=Haloarcula nitratireducens TaxID=2487749 RepID=A0AAW4P9M7_9EURY|nr:hypothetical protein [Halomicroarcula nitratireducens]MBX0294614.1 hypothetical protein [Halomicroarcula nitratireducens]